MKKLIQEAANAVVANLQNTSAIGLFNGKMGVVLFMYEYANSFSCSTIYEKIADTLIDEIYEQVKPDMSLSIRDGNAGIGIGLSYLLKNHLIEGNPNVVLEDVDKYLLDNPKNTLLKEMTYPVPVFSSGLYFLSRACFCSDRERYRWGHLLSEAAKYFVLDVVKKKGFQPPLSLLNSMLFILNKLSIDFSIYSDNDIIQLQQEILMQVIKTLEKGLFVNVDILLLKGIKRTLQVELCEEYDSKVIPLLSSLKTSPFNMEDLNDELWWYFVYGRKILSIYSREDIEKYIEKKMLDYSYDIEIVNSQLSILGLLLMKM